MEGLLSFSVVFSQPHVEQYRLSGDGTTHERDLCTSTAPQVGNHGDHAVHEYTVITNKLRVTVINNTLCLYPAVASNLVHIIL